MHLKPLEVIYRPALCFQHALCLIAKQKKGRPNITAWQAHHKTSLPFHRRKKRQTVQTTTHLELLFAVGVYEKPKVPFPTKTQSHLLQARFTQGARLSPKTTLDKRKRIKRRKTITPSQRENILGRTE